MAGRFRIDPLVVLAARHDDWHLRLAAARVLARDDAEAARRK